MSYGQKSTFPQFIASLTVSKLIDQSQFYLTSFAVTSLQKYNHTVSLYCYTALDFAFLCAILKFLLLLPYFLQYFPLGATNFNVSQDAGTIQGWEQNKGWFSYVATLSCSCTHGTSTVSARTSMKLMRNCDKST